MVDKIFSNEGNELRTLLNDNNQCYIEICSDSSGYYTGFITLDSDDLLIFISELQDIRKSMENG